jgi:type II secretory pathway component GspD/PulD (secretin)
LRAIREKENKMLGFRKLALIVLACLMVPLAGLAADTSEITGIKVVNTEGNLRIEINKVGDVKFDAFTMGDPDRLIVDCVGAKYNIPWDNKMVDSPLIHRIRTSQLQVDPMMISRIVLDLKQDVIYKTWNENDVQVVEVLAKNAGNVNTAARTTGETQTRTPVTRTEEATARTAAGAGTTTARNTAPTATAAMGPVLPLIKPTGSEKTEQRRSTPPEPEKNEKPAETQSPWIDDAASKGGKSAGSGTDVAASRNDYDPASLAWSEPYMRGAPAGGGGLGMGSRRITLDAQGADIKTVLRTISEFAGVNIVAGSDVKGDVNVHIKDAPWEEALDILLRAHGFGYREEFGMIRVAELTRLTKEELDLQQAERKKEDLQPLITRIIFVNNSNAQELQNALQNVVSQRGRIDVDFGSNALIVNDIEQNVEKIGEMVTNLDKKNFQVDINAKLVEVDVEATRELGINWGLLNIHASGFGGVGSAEVTEGLPMSSGTLKFGTVRSWGELNTVLEMLEKSNKANIISNPRITTMDNREASILVGKEIPLIVADEAGNPITELTKIGIMLRVIPHVNSDRTITLDLHPEVSELQSESTTQGGVIISTSEADTRVVVNDGETAVIGGLIKKVTTEIKRGVPYLKDVPYLGALFSSTSTADKKQELVIFVTPTIVE